MNNSRLKNEVIIKNRKYRHHQYGERWPKFWAITFKPESMGPTTAGGVIGPDENFSEAIFLDLQYLCDLFELIAAEDRLNAFFSNKHRTWIFYSSENLGSLGFGSRAMTNFVLKEIKKKEKFYEQILRHHQTELNSQLATGTPPILSNINTRVRF